MAIRALIDTSSLVSPRGRRELQQTAQLGAFVPIWSPWIIAELNRVIVWRWIKKPCGGRPHGDVSTSSERECGRLAKWMMQRLLPSFELVAPVPPYPAPWDSLNDVWDHPIWAAAKMSRAQYVVS